MSDAPGTGLSRQKAKAFADKWSGAKSEKQLAQSFWSDFFRQVIEVEDLLNAGIEFEYPIKNKETGIPTFVDVLWGGVVLIEHKSAGKNLDLAEIQARGYLSTLPAKVVAPFIIVSDFANFRIIDIYLGQTVEFALSDLPDNLHRIEAVFRNYNKNATIEEVTADADAVALMSELFITLEKAGCEDHAVSVFLVRVLFLLFGDDTAMWKKDAFRTIIENSRQDGVGLGGRLGELFARLDDETQREVDAELQPFPYVNGGLFSDSLTPFNINVTLVTFGFVMSSVFVAWAKAVSGRIKNDPRISNTITYNNFPFPDLLDKDKKAIELASQGVLDARAKFLDDSLAVLYSRDAMPTELRKAHDALDKAVLNSFGLRTNSTEIGVLEELFNRYAAIVNGLLAATPEKRARRR